MVYFFKGLWKIISDGVEEGDMSVIAPLWMCVVTPITATVIWVGLFMEDTHGSIAFIFSAAIALMLGTGGAMLLGLLLIAALAVIETASTWFVRMSNIGRQQSTMQPKKKNVSSKTETMIEQVKKESELIENGMVTKKDVPMQDTPEGASLPGNKYGL